MLTVVRPFPQGLAPRAPCGAGRGLVRWHRLGLRRARADEEAHLSEHRPNQQAHGSSVGGSTAMHWIPLVLTMNVD
jgi:hypothetical protein